MSKAVKQPNTAKEELFNPVKHKQHRKGTLYHDLRINQEPGKRDFLTVEGAKLGDLDFLRRYLRNEIPQYHCEQYNMFTTGVDKNGAALVGLYWTDDSAELIKVAMVLCRNGEEAILEVIDDCCVAADVKQRTWEAQVAAQPETPKPTVIVTGARSGIDKYRKV